jgi:hypothetical protein
MRLQMAKGSGMNWKLGAVAALGFAASAGAQGTAPQGDYELAIQHPVYHLMAMPAAVEGQNGNEPAAKDDLFAGTEVFAKNATNVTEITMDPTTLDMVGGRDEHKAHSMVLNVVRTYEYDKPGMYNMADVDTFRNKLNSGDWHCSVHVRDLKTGESTDVCNKQRTDGLKESAIISVQPKELTFIHTIRRSNGPGSSDVGFFPMLPGMAGLPAMAMMDPDAFIQMQIAMHSAPMVLMPGFKLQMDQAKNQIKMLDSPEMQKQFEEMKKQLKVLPQIKMDQKQIDDLNRQLKDLPKIEIPQPESPSAPDMPETPKP